MIRGAVLVLVAAAAAIFAVVPPRAIEVASPDPAAPVRGVVHVHTRRSDGTGTVEDVARAAARAGLNFVVLTDHGDGTRPPDPPVYLSNVLVLDAVEISTDHGHVVAIGLPQAPYPLGGEARDVVEDVHRLGGLAIAAHPGSPKPELGWEDWDAPVDGIEWLNGDSEWRDERWPALLRVLVSYPFRPSEALATLLDRPDAVMSRWDALTVRRPVFAVAAADAHARVGLTSIGEPYDTRASLPLPSYAAVFSALSVTLDGISFSRDATADARAVVQALTDGRVYSTIDGLARGGRLAFSATSGDSKTAMGGRIVAGGDITFRVSVTGPDESRISLYRNGLSFKTASGLRLEAIVPPDPAVYRVEVTLPEAGGTHPVPWMVGNPIYVGTAPAAPEAGASRAPVVERPWSVEHLRGARVEHSAGSDAAVNVTTAAGGREILYRYALGGRPSDHPYAAIVLPWPMSSEPGGRIRFAAHADRPMRLSVQLRSPGPADGYRWRRSIYLDATERAYVVALADLQPVNGIALQTHLGEVDSLLFVVDDVNTPLGNGGRVWISGLTYER